MKKNDRRFLILVFILLLIITGAFYLSANGYGGKIQVTVDGSLYGIYSLSENQEIKIEKDEKVTNILIIKDGKANMIDADCPDKLCVHQRAISKTKETIVCLPNKVVIEVLGNKESELDSVAK